MSSDTTVIVSDGFDDLQSRDVRMLDEASRLGGRLHVLLWTDDVVRARTGAPPKFPFDERAYLLESIRDVAELAPMSDASLSSDALPESVVGGRGGGGVVWAVRERDDSPRKREWCAANGVAYRVLNDAALDRYPDAPPAPLSPPSSSRRKIVVTGCFDWFHSGHVRFFEEVSELGDLYVVVGHDANIRLLKGEGHPLFPAAQRCYTAGAVRFVTQALVSSGDGWMDAEPEFLRIRPDAYAVNEDGDKPEKRAFCQEHGIEYIVLSRQPRQGLPRRQSTALRGF